MPNWCSNDLEIRGLTKEEVQTISQKYVELDENNIPSVLDFEKILPTPLALLNEQAPSNKSQETKEGLIRAYGAEDWYNWRIKNWGTKWTINPDSACIRMGDDHVSFSFDSAWAPPEEIISYMSTLFPKAKFTLQYAEPGMAFAGERIYENGKVTSQNEDENGEIMKALCGDDWNEAEEENEED